MDCSEDGRLLYELMHNGREWGGSGASSDRATLMFYQRVAEVFLARREVPEAELLWPNRVPPAECKQGPHRGPEGPNEDLAQCPFCWSLSWTFRPVGETFGEHAPDCAGPYWHERGCPPGGSGQSPSRKIRG